ncbi:MAG: outer membrane beta-barrel protein [Bacteroidales bacterium]
MIYNRLLRSAALWALLIFAFPCFAQEGNARWFYGAGLNLGWYSPSLDYWQENSEFKDAAFGGAVSVRAFAEAKIKGDLHAAIGVGYWQESTDDDLQGFGNTTMLLTGYPISLDLLYYLSPMRFSVITPYAGLGGEYLIVQHKLEFEQKDNPDPTTGSTVSGKAIFGFEARLSEQFALDLDFNYKFGHYQQEFNREVPDPNDPDNPPDVVIETEDISLNGPQIGLTLKYIF